MLLCKKAGLGAALLGSLVLLTPALAAAQTEPGPAAKPAAAPTRTPTAAEKEEASARFTRALELAEDGSLDAALEELKRAYALAPTYRILYNIGLVYQALQDYARALDAFEQYLDEGGAEIAADRLDEVNGRINRLKNRVGYLDIRANEPNADVAVDDLPVGKTPVGKPLRVKSGRRRVTVTLPGRAPITQAVELAGAETRIVQFDLRVAPPPVIIAEQPKSPVPWISWGVTAAVAGAAAVTGVLALNAASNYDEKKAEFNADPNVVRSDLDDLRGRARAFGIATDVLGAVAIAGVGVSIYFSIKPPKSGRASSAKQVGLVTGGKMIGLRYTF